MSIKLKGSTDGSVTLQAPADTSPSGSDKTLTLPTTVGSANQFVKNGDTAGQLEYSSMVETSTGDVQARRARSNTAGDVALSVQPSDSTIHYGLRIDADNNSLNLDRASGTATNLLRIDSSGLITQGGKTASNHGSPNLLLWGADPTLHITSTGSVNNSSYSGIKFAVAGGSTGDYSKAGIFVQRQDSYNDLDMLFAFRASNDATGVSPSDEKMRIDSSGNVSIGSSTINQTSSGRTVLGINGSSNALLNFNHGDTLAGFMYGANDEFRMEANGSRPLIFRGNGSERMRIDSSGKVGIGTSSPQAKLHISDDNGRLRFTNTTGSGTAGIDYYANATERGYTRMDFSAGALAIGTNPAWPITFTTNTAERARIDSDGNFLVGKNTLSDTATGLSMRVGGVIAFEATVGSGASHCMMLNRQGDDGAFVKFRQANTLEGTITVSGSTVSYNGGHLARWSQLPSGAERTEILRGSVLSNLDEMCEWGEEDNEQLNRMKISDVEGDVNVSGVFQDWDDNDDAYTNDFYCAMTGDFVIRIAQGTTVARGDLLMSAGDGTAKPQDDDIVRSKTIAKVTSTTVSTTYSDGSYCVPCVLMAC